MRSLTEQHQCSCWNLPADNPDFHEYTETLVSAGVAWQGFTNCRLFRSCFSSPTGSSRISTPDQSPFWKY